MYDRLVELCKMKNTSVTALCKKITGSKGNLSTWKKGHMNSEDLAACADYLGVSADYLLGRSESPILVATWDELYRMIDNMSDAQIDSLLLKIRDRLSEQQHQAEQGHQ